MTTPNCPVCSTKMNVTRLYCKPCDITVKGNFDSDRFSGFSTEQLFFMEAFILAGGNLKELQQTLSLSYPTVRSRLDDLVLQMRTLHEKDAQDIQRSLTNELENSKHKEIISKLTKNQ